MPLLLPVKQAQATILESVQSLETEIIPLRAARGRYLAAPLCAEDDLPPFSNSSADGFAVRAADTQSAGAQAPVELSVVGDIPAGSTPDFSIAPGQAARIMTGAPLPNGADAVVMVEATDAYFLDQGPFLGRTVRVQSPVQPGDSLRLRGQDLRAGTPLFAGGHCLRSQDLGLLASLGFAQLSVHRRPRIALLSTGDELIDPAEPLQPGKIRDANTSMLAALFEEHGAIVTHAGFVRDDEIAIRDRLDECVAAGIDLLVTSAGVSVGAFDYVRKIIAERGELAFWKVDMRPGKPLAFGSYRAVPVIGLPGNPVSAFVGGLIFVVPALRKMAGAGDWFAATLRAKLLEDAESDGRESYLRANLENRGGNWYVKPSGQQGSGNLFALTRSNALLILPSGVKSLPAGTDADVYPLADKPGWE